MTIEEAIRVNEENEAFFTKKYMITCAKAVRLGIEALRFFKEHRKWYIDSLTTPLPGETEE